eukprot:TRINITY_DN490_c0_g1_i2.p1 TRINITY_DN490_c0_g1~~TRINITY_DN490_c0_g1_i2.p1  ORF type:complete len:402 (-),score=8.80 TRINITY_DN490_c0_g1_i2:1254-2459(-)
MIQLQKLSVFFLSLLCLCKLEVVPFGFFETTGERALPMRNITFQATAYDGLLKMEMIQVYENPYDSKINVLYAFPVSYDMAVTGLTIETEDVIVRATLMEAEKARKIYEEAIKKGQQAYYLSYDGKQYDILKLAAGNIEPHQKIKVYVTLVQKLNVEDLSWAIRIPMTYTPRYCNPNYGPCPVSALPPLGSFATYMWSLDLTISTSARISRLVCFSHDLDVRFTDNMTTAHASLENVEEPLGNDLVILYRNSLTSEPQIMVQQNDTYNATAVILSFIPTAQNVPVSNIVDRSNRTYYSQEKNLVTKGEFIFILDCSGSMTGEKIAMAKHAMGQVLLYLIFFQHYQIVVQEKVLNGLLLQLEFIVYCFNYWPDREIMIVYRGKRYEITCKQCEGIEIAIRII